MECQTLIKPSKLGFAIKLSNFACSHDNIDQRKLNNQYSCFQMCKKIAMKIWKHHILSDDSYWYENSKIIDSRFCSACKPYSFKWLNNEILWRLFKATSAGHKKGVQEHCSMFDQLVKNKAKWQGPIVEKTVSHLDTRLLQSRWKFALVTAWKDEIRLKAETRDICIKVLQKLLNSRWKKIIHFQTFPQY